MTPAHDFALAIASRMPELVSGDLVKVGDPDGVARSGKSALGVFCTNRTWRDPVDHLDGGIGRRESMPGVLVRVRGDKEDPATAQMIAGRIATEMHGRPPTGYYDCVALGSGVLAVGPDPSDGFPRFDINFGLKRDEVPRPAYFGAAADPGGGITAGFVQSLTAAPGKLRAGHVFAATAAAGARLWYAYPSAFGDVAFFDGLIGRTPIAFTKLATVGLTLPTGSETFFVWGSTALGLGAKTVKAL